MSTSGGRAVKGCSETTDPCLKIASKEVRGSEEKVLLLNPDFFILQDIAETFFCMRSASDSSVDITVEQFSAIIYFLKTLHLTKTRATSIVSGKPLRLVFWSRPKPNFG